MPLGHDEQVHGRLRVDVLEGQDGVVLVDDVGRTLTCDDPAKGAIAHRGPPKCLYNTAFVETSDDDGGRGTAMGTCPKCKLRIRKNGNHIKLGSVWYHKMCPSNLAAKTT